MIGQNIHGRTFPVLIEKLLDHLKKNRNEHQEIVEEAQVAFRNRAIKEMDRMIAQAKKGEEIVMRVNLTVPTIHLKEYDNAIGILGMTKEAGETTVEITADEYDRFVDNNWDWTRNFATSNAPYSRKAADL